MISMKKRLETVLLVIGILSGCSLSLRKEVIDDESNMRREIYIEYLEKEHIVAPLIDVEFMYKGSKKYCDDEKSKRRY